MTYIVTDGNVLLVDRCLTSKYENTIAKEEDVTMTHRQEKQILNNIQKRIDIFQLNVKE